MRVAASQIHWMPQVLCHSRPMQRQTYAEALGNRVDLTAFRRSRIGLQMLTMSLNNSHHDLCRRTSGRCWLF